MVPNCIHGLEPFGPPKETTGSTQGNRWVRLWEPLVPLVENDSPDAEDRSPCLRKWTVCPGKDCAKIRKPPENIFLSCPFIRNINNFVQTNSFNVIRYE